ncbi:hypothetical protein NKG94_00800 [Micromonospora sp. M12]
MMAGHDGKPMSSSSDRAWAASPRPGDRQFGGKRVLVLEQHYTLGGMTHEFSRAGRFHFGTGLHYVSATAGPFLDFVTDGRVQLAPLPEDYDVLHFRGSTSRFPRRRNGSGPVSWNGSRPRPKPSTTSSGPPAARCPGWPRATSSRRSPPVYGSSAPRRRAALPVGVPVVGRAGPAELP